MGIQEHAIRELQQAMREAADEANKDVDSNGLHEDN